MDASDYCKNCGIGECIPQELIARARRLVIEIPECGSHPVEWPPSILFAKVLDSLEATRRNYHEASAKLVKQTVDRQEIALAMNAELDRQARHLSDLASSMLETAIETLLDRDNI